VSSPHLHLYLPYPRSHPPLPQFLQPGDLRLASRTFRRPPPAPPHLGPSASASRARDPFHQLALDPAWEYKNATLLAAFQTDMAKILPRAQTRLTWRSQRKLRAAVKRAKMIGLTPLWSQAGQMARLPTAAWDAASARGKKGAKPKPRGGAA
jgi:small subunit ribosomal protein S18